MKKQILVSSLIAAGILAGTTAFVISSANAKTTNNSNNSTNLIAVSDSAIKTAPALNTKDETIFVIADTEGKAVSKYVGNTLYTGTNSLPFDFKTTYYLNGAEIKASDLAGKSGHVKIVYRATSTTKFQNQSIPFVAVTGMTLDRSTFSNIKITNGKIVNELTDNYLIAGYALVGLNENLGTDFLPSEFIVEADTTNFKLTNTYTVLMNDLIADIDTSKLTDLDSVINSIYELSDGLNKIVNGATDLSNGLGTALDGTKALYAGSLQLVDGLNTLVSHNAELQYGANAISSTILDAINQVISLLNSLGIETTYSAATLDNYLDVYNDIISKINFYKEAVESRIDELGLSGSQAATFIENAFTAAINGVTVVKQLIDFSIGVVDYTNGVAKVATGATTLSNGLGALVEGQTKLYEGSVTLKNGLNTFKTAGIDKLVNFASNDLAGFIRNARSSVSAAASYRSFSGSNTESVKFIIKTPSI